MSAIVESDDDQALLADAAAVLAELESQPNGEEGAMENAVMQDAEAELAEGEVFAGLLSSAVRRAQREVEADAAGR